jgi:hypothetical protein
MATVETACRRSGEVHGMDVIMSTMHEEDMHLKAYRDGMSVAGVNVGLTHHIRVLQRARGWDDEEMARRIGVSVRTLREYCTCGTPLSIKVIKKFANAFDVAFVVQFCTFDQGHKRGMKIFHNIKPYEETKP